MKDCKNSPDDLLKIRRKEVLNNSEGISHKKVIEKVKKEYELF